MQNFRNQKQIIFIFLALLVEGGLQAKVQGIPVPIVSVQQMRLDINELNRHVDNQENEIQQIKERFASLEEIIDDIRKQHNNASSNHREQLQSSNVALETKIGNLEFTIKGLLSDIQVLKSHLNESVGLKTDYQQQLSRYEKQIATQNQNIEKMQTALKSVMELLHADEEKESTTESIYQVKPGDTLEKIANAHGTTVKAIKDLNQLSIDRIKIGQKLKMPPK